MKLHFKIHKGIGFVIKNYLAVFPYRHKNFITWIWLKLEYKRIIKKNEKRRCILENTFCETCGSNAYMTDCSCIFIDCEIPKLLKSKGLQW